jgi:DHHC palmitoyltransferase
VVSIFKKCIAPKPLQTHHCSVCNKCILKMDTLCSGGFHLQEMHRSQASTNPSLQRLQQVHFKNGPPLSLVSIVMRCACLLFYYINYDHLWHSVIRIFISCPDTDSRLFFSVAEPVNFCAALAPACQKFQLQLQL